MLSSIIYIDADACPVKDEALKVAARHEVKVVVVSNGGLRPSRNPLIEHVIVAKDSDAADDYIAEKAVKNDIILTADIPLAARGLEKEALVLNFNGKTFTQADIGMKLAMRELNQHLRDSGAIKGYNRPFSPKDRSEFLQKLENTIQQLKKQNI